MTSRELPRLSLEDLASVIDGELNGLSEDAWTALKRMIAAMYSDDLGHIEQLAELRAMAQDAACKFLGDALVALEQVEQLLAADNWEHPVEVIGGGREDVAYPRLIRVAKARAERDEDPGRVVGVKRRLMGAYAEHLTERAARRDSAAY